MNSDPPDSDSDVSSVPSRPPSPTAPTSPAAPPTLARLINHFLSAKRSLNSTSFVYRANELVTSSRALIEEIAILSARNSYSTHDIEEGVDILAKIKDGVARDGQAVATDFAQVIKRLDVANEKLEKTLADLKGTGVDKSLQKDSHSDDQEISEDDTNPSTSDTDEGEAPQTLYTFIDPSKHEQLQSSLRKDIDDYHAAHDDITHTLTTFDESLATISNLLHQDSGPNKSPLYNSPISALFAGVEDHATAMATLLDSLVRHYDLSVTALKHTEGGGEAAKRAVQATSPSPADEVVGGVEESLYLKANPEPISSDERDEMLAVLENDADEVEDVVSELRDRNREQESLFSQLAENARSSKHQDARLRELLTMLHEMRDLHLPAHLAALQTFRLSWARIREAILDKTEAMLGLAGANESFLAAYTQLLEEVERRRSVRAQMRKVAEKANRELRRLWERDREERREFLEEFGAFLPLGIWEGAEEGGGLWEVREVES